MLSLTSCCFVLFVIIAVLQAVQMYGYNCGTISYLTSHCMLLLVILVSECWKQIRWDYRHSSSIAGGCFIPDMAQHVMPSKQGPHVSSFGAKWWSPRLQKGRQRNIWKILGLDLDRWSATMIFTMISYCSCAFCCWNPFGCFQKGVPQNGWWK